jgi:glucose/arabinose dehydrogenase
MPLQLALRDGGVAMINWRAGSALAFATALLAACGGGGGSSADTQVPSAALTSPAPFADGLTGVVTLSASATDNVGVAAVEFQVDGRLLASTASGPPYQANLNTANHAAGQHVVRARARDAAGNVSAWSSATVRFGGSASIAQGFVKDEAWVVALSAATAMAQAPDGRLFVAEQGGSVRIVKNGVLLATPFVQLVVDATGERGLIGITLHPDFATNGFVYLHYTTAAGGTHNRVSRFTANPLNPDIVSVGSEVPLVDLPALAAATNHNGGAIHFGTDGKLYIGVGDNANGANSQNPNTPLGKLLRVNDDGSIPADNPFPARPGLAAAIWASGLRNPFTFAVQPLGGRIHINDVGQNTWEEVNLGSAGANYGWPGSEGPDNVGAGVSAPLFTYKHSATAPAGTGPGGFFVGFSIAGGAFYPNTGPFPAERRGNYFFADFVNRFVAVLDLANGNAAYAFASLAGSPVDMLVGLDGALYVLTRSAITRIAAQ